MPEWYIGNPVLVHWVAIAMFHMAVVGFALIGAYEKSISKSQSGTKVLITLFFHSQQKVTKGNKFADSITASKQSPCNFSILFYSSFTVYQH